MTNKDEPISFSERESSTKITTQENHQHEIEIFTDIINVFLSGFSSMHSFELNEDNESEYIWLLILIRSFNSIRCAIDLMLKGYYSQAMSIIRTVTEDWFICGTVKDNDKVRDCLLRDGKMPKYIDLATQMSALNIYRNDYHYQSTFTHSTRLSLRVLYDLEKKMAKVVPTYDEDLFLLCTESLMRVSIFIFDYMARFLSYIGKDTFEDWDKQNSVRRDNVIKWLDDLREKYGNPNAEVNTD